MELDEITERFAARFGPQLTEARPLIERFCSLYDVSLVSVSVTRENVEPEPAYTFSDNLGYYTIEGIKNSL